MIGRRARVVLLAGVAVALCSLRAQGALQNVEEQPLIADDGTRFVLTTGVVSVPERHGASADTAKRIDLAVVRVRTGEVPSRVAHVFLAGGPGDSAVRIVLGLAKKGGAAWAQMAQGDIIGIDQRGIGKSKPSLASNLRFDLPLDVPGSIDGWLPRIVAVSRQAAAEFVAQGIDLAAYNTVESADDIDVVRRELGYDRIILWGRSYGTHLALATLKRHPETVERVILVSPLGLDQMWKTPLQVDVVLRRLAERAATPTLLADMREVIARVAREPVTVTIAHPASGLPVTVALSSFDLQWLTGQALADPRHLTKLPAAYREMKAGDFKRMATLALLLRTTLGVESGMKQMMKISSGATAARRARIARETPEAVLGDAMNFPGMYADAAWPAADLDDEFRAPVRSAIPVLILVGDLDARTPVENGQDIIATLPNGRLVVVENAAHEFDLFGSSPIRELLAQFLRGMPVTTQRIVQPPLHFD